MLREQSPAQTQPANPLEVLERAQGLLEEQRAELARWIADLQSVQASLGQEGAGDGQPLIAENEELREMEMEMSRERAELARERQRLERLRDEVKVDLERLQRDGGMRESLAPVQRLREEMHGKKQPAGKTPHPEEAGLNDRLRSL